MILGIFGPSSAVSSMSAHLQSSLESRLRQRKFGSTLCSLTWKHFITPAGRQLCRLLASVPRIAETASGLLPTPAAQSYGSNQGGAAGRTGKVRPSLEAMARTGLLPSPTAKANMLAPSMQKWPAHRNLWPTPRSTDGDHGSRVTPRKARNGGNLIEAVSMVLYPTPTSLSFAESHQPGNSRNMTKLREIAIAAGETPGPLNPEFVSWLMGYPPEWLSCAPLATPSSRKSRLSSSRQAAKLLQVEVAA